MRHGIADEVIELAGRKRRPGHRDAGRVGLKTLHDTYDYIEAVIAEKRQKFSLPAAGIIGALHTTSKVLNKARTREELDRVLSARPGYFETLPSLHLIVQEPSQQREVHRLAKELQRTLERKKAELR